MEFNYNKDKANIIATKSGNVKLRTHLSHKATKLQSINGKPFLRNREDLKESYNLRGLAGVQLHVVTEILRAKLISENKRLSLWDKIKIWWYAR